MLELPAGSPWGPFQIERLLGRGDRSLLYRAARQSDGRTVALRVFDETLDEPTLNRFEDDTRRLVGLTHPNILKVESVGREGKARYFVTEYFQALSLRDCGPRPLREGCDLMLQTAKALSAAWMRLVLHRNLKPENILVSSRWEVKVADFGLFTEPTPYWSPERKAGRSPDLRGDLFSLGTIFREFLKEPDADVAKLLDHLTNAEPFDRVQMVEDVISRLESILARMPAAAAPSLSPAPVAPPLPTLPPKPFTMAPPAPPPPMTWTPPPPPAADPAELKKAREAVVSTLAAVAKRPRPAPPAPMSTPAADEIAKLFARIDQQRATPPPPPIPTPGVERRPQPPPSSPPPPPPAPPPPRQQPRKKGNRGAFVGFLLILALAIASRVLKDRDRHRGDDVDDPPVAEVPEPVERPKPPPPPTPKPDPGAAVAAEWARTKETIRKLEADEKYQEAAAACDKFVNAHLSDAPPESKAMRTELTSWSRNVQTAEKYRKIGNGDLSLEPLNRGGAARAKDKQRILDRWCEEDWVEALKESKKASEEGDGWTARESIDRFLKRPHQGGAHKAEAEQRKALLQADLDFAEVSDRVQAHLRLHRETQAIEALEAFLALPHKGGTKREQIEKQIAQIKEELKQYLFSGRLTVNRFTVSADGKKAAFTSDGMKVVDVESRQIVWSQPARSLVRLMAFAPDGRLGAVLSNTVSLWDLPQNKESIVLTSANGFLTGLAFSRDGKRAYASHSDGSLVTWALDKAEPLQVDKAAAVSTSALALSPDGATIAIAQRDKSIRIRTLATGEERKWTAPSVSTMLAWSPDGSLLASANGDETVVLWDPKKDEPTLVLKGHKGAVAAVAFSPDGKSLASGGSDKAVRLWTVKDGAEAGVLEGHRERITGLAYLPDGTLLSAGADATVRIWKRKD